MSRYYKRFMLTSVVEKFNRVFVGPGIMKWDYQKDHGYNVWLGQTDVYDGLSLRGAVKAVQMAISVSEDINALITKMSAGNKKFWENRHDELQSMVDGLTNENAGLRQRCNELEAQAFSKVSLPSSEEIRVTLALPFADGNKETVLNWAYLLADRSLNKEDGEFVKLNPMDVDLFALVYTEVSKQPIDKINWDDGFVRKLCDVMLHRYRRAIRVVLALCEPAAAVAVPVPIPMHVSSMPAVGPTL